MIYIIQTGWVYEGGVVIGATTDKLGAFKFVRKLLWEYQEKQRRYEPWNKSVLELTRSHKDKDLYLSWSDGHEWFSIEAHEEL